MNTFEISVPELRRYTDALHAGDRVILSGIIYTARDAAHKKLFELLDKGLPLPFNIKDAVIYYAGPTPGHDDVKVGSCGPTTSSRMDGFAPRLYDMGLAASIGKGERNNAVRDAIIRNKAAYFCAVGGAGALISRHITDAEEVAFPELGCESVKRLTIEKMPLTVALDIYGGDIFREGRERYRIGQEKR